MKYGEVKYKEMRSLHQPNIVIGRGNQGDWVDRFDEPEVTIAEDEVILEGFNAIDEYAESALERFEDDGDVQAGLVAIHILHHYNEHFGNTTGSMHNEIIAKLLDEKWPNSYLYILAEDANPALAASLHGAMRTRAKAATSLGGLASDRHLMAYLEATSKSESVDDSLRHLIGYRQS